MLRVSTVNSPLTYYTVNKAPAGMDYELAKRFARYLGVRLEITVRANISDLFDALDDGKADLLAAGLIYNNERLNRYQTGPSYYSVSQQLIYRVDKTRPKTWRFKGTARRCIRIGLSVYTQERQSGALSRP